MHSQDKQANQVEGRRRGKWESGSWRGERHMSASTHFKSLSLICEEPENFEDKKVALQRSYHSVSRLVSWSDNSRRSQAAAYCPLMSASQHFLLPLMSGWQDHSTFPFVEAVVKRFLDTLPFCLLSSPSVTLHFKPHPHPRLYITVCAHHSLSCPLQSFTGESHHIAVSRAKHQES